MTVAANAADVRILAPKGNGQATIVPSLATIEHRWFNVNGSSGAVKFEQSLNSIDCCGSNLLRVRRQARQEAIALAIEYTSRYKDIDSRIANTARKSETPLLLTGHQPELYHAGVWFKSFLLSHLADITHGIGINFLVDNDLCRSTAIRVPSWTSDRALIANSVVFDRPGEAVPWEMRSLKDDSTWGHFPKAIRENLADEIDDPMVASLWAQACRSKDRDPRIGYAIAEARHCLEASIGLSTLEVPLSKLVRASAFARFSIQLLSELPRLQMVYNQQRELFRAANGIRSQAHPVPALEQRDGWLEAPWWIYRNQAPQRRPLWVRMVDHALRLSDFAGWEALIDGRLDSDQAAEQWMQLQEAGVHLRPRALLTTMYTRLVIGDTFVHGIGGGKYDQLTDNIIRDFFGIAPPEFIVATATAHLPLASMSVTESPTVIQQRLWLWKHHPEQALQSSSGGEEYQKLAQEKATLVANIPPRGQRWDWHHAMTQVNRRLRELTEHVFQTETSRLEQATINSRQQRLLTSREYSFCLFDRDYLVPLLQSALKSHQTLPGK